ncbi:type II toxin-antitoxin system VapC family toxin [Acidithiobacillus ferriphilus]|jgi:predicted nucleic-acid-binding protein|uniref:type II toxin-antitoxin system VapC family toxin n=1 Tax=Acidithiobacillus ferriphilus TaxID=1689834 RepID=UPI002DBD011D|nr:type II toxin-antitoxin system VapC family toxin [Acidithiobacillus ferriphilus]MEB8475021.1 type II toxin-antitoxin system VapC family toxin [Acidithiobacillus ferriphilus]
MIALDTNILARFYVVDPADPEAAKQRTIAHRLLTESSQVFVPLTVILELEWVLRAFYGFADKDFVRVVKHLLGLPNVSVEEWSRIADALAWHTEGLDFADALHLLASSHCTEFMSFDDRRFARRAKRLGATPAVVVPAK